MTATVPFNYNVGDVVTDVSGAAYKIIGVYEHVVLVLEVDKPYWSRICMSKFDFNAHFSKDNPIPLEETTDEDDEEETAEE